MYNMELRVVKKIANIIFLWFSNNNIKGLFLNIEHIIEYLYIYKYVYICVCVIV